MSKVKTYRYSVDMFVPGYHLTPAVWRVRNSGQLRGYGKPTDANLARHVAEFEASTRPGGANAHLGETTVFSARVHDADTQTVVARYSKESVSTS